MLYGRREFSFNKLETSASVLSENNSATGIGWTVSESDRNVRRKLIGNRYHLDSFRQAVRLMVVNDHVIHDSRVNVASENRPYLKKNNLKQITDIVT